MPPIPRYCCMLPTSRWLLRWQPRPWWVGGIGKYMKTWENYAEKQLPSGKHTKSY